MVPVGGLRPGAAVGGDIAGLSAEIAGNCVESPRFTGLNAGIVLGRVESTTDRKSGSPQSMTGSDGLRAGFALRYQ